MLWNDTNSKTEVLGEEKPFPVVLYSSQIVWPGVELGLATNHLNHGMAVCRFKLCLARFGVVLL